MSSVIEPVATLAAGGDTHVLSGLNEAKITASGDNERLPDMLYMRAALYGTDSSGNKILLADSPWQVASSLAVQGSSNVAAFAGAAAGLKALEAAGNTAYELVVLAPTAIGSHMDRTEVTDEQVLGLAAVEAAPGSTPVRVFAWMAKNAGFISVVSLMVGFLVKYVLNEVIPTDLPTINPDEDPATPQRVNKFLGRERVSWRPFVELNDASMRTAVATALRQCDSLAVVENFSKTQCDDLAVFAPGLDVKAASFHDFEAITENGKPAILNYGPSHNAWYGGLCGTYDTSVKQCDEYPFNSSLQGGPNAAPPASLKVIKRGDNVDEGNMYKAFVNVCGLKVSGLPFLVVPTVKDADGTGAPPSFARCAYGFTG